MSVASLLAEAKAVQAKLVKALQDEYFCDDLEPPPAAFGWPEDDLREFFENGGSDLAAGAPTPAPASTPAPAPVALAPSECSPGRPIILCLGDATTEFGSHIINMPTADVGSSKSGKASLSVVVEPVATEFLRETGTDNPRIEHGPGWAALLARDYAWRTTADVVNRGLSGCTSSLLRADLPEILGALRRDDVIAVTLMIGANDACVAGQPTHVPVGEYQENMAWILAELKRQLPKAGIIVVSPPPLDEPQWKLTCTKATSNRLSGEERTAANNVEYGKAAEVCAKKAGAQFIDLIYKLKYEMANAMMELQNPARDGLHFTKAVNIFLYRNVKSKARGPVGRRTDACRRD